MHIRLQYFTLLLLLSCFYGTVSFGQASKKATVGIRNFETVKFAITENKGQFESSLRFYSQLPGADIYFSGNHIKFDLRKKGSKQSHEMLMELVGANPFVQISAEEKLAGRNNFYLPGQLANAENVHQYKALLYKDIYAGIDLRFKLLENNGLKYEFIVHPGADVNQIKIKWKGAEVVSFNENGGLVYEQRGVKITDSKPVCYSEGKLVESRFINSEGITTFQVNDYNRNSILVIDPILQWSTYYGSYGPREIIPKVKSDIFGNVYAMMQYTTEYDSRLITPAYDSIKWAMSSVYTIVKFDSSGNRCWATFIYESADMSVDDSGNVYILSYLDSSAQSRGSDPESWYRLVTKNTHQIKVLGSLDVFIIKLDSAGYLKWGTLYGGNEEEYPNAILAKNGFVYIGGQTYSNDEISTIGGTSSKSIPDAFLAKLTADGKREFGVYIAGFEGEECVSEIAVDDGGNIYVCGSTSAKTGYGMSGAFQSRASSTNSDNWDGYLVKYDKNGKKKWGTYYSKNAIRNYVKSVSVDKNGNVFIFSASPINHQSWSEKSIDSCYIARFDSTGKRIWEVAVKDTLPIDVVYSFRYYHVFKRDYRNSWMQVDNNGNIVISGYINEWSGKYYHGITPTNNALKKKPESGDGYILIYNSIGQRKYASYFGGKYHDEIRFAAGAHVEVIIYQVQLTATIFIQKMHTIPPANTIMVTRMVSWQG